MAAYSITFNPLQLKNAEQLEISINAISNNAVKVFNHQYIINSDLSLNAIVNVISSCLTEGSPMFVNLIDARLYHLQHLDPVVGDQLTQVLF